MGMNIYSTIARHLRRRRLRAGLTLEDLADAAGISVSFLAYLETNKKKPSLATVAKIAAALNVPVSELFNEKTVPNVPDEKQKILNRIIKILQNQSPENADVILAAVTALAKKLSVRRPR